MNPFKQLSLMLWKNALLHWRSKVYTIFEIVLPIFFLSLIITFLSNANKNNGDPQYRPNNEEKIEQRTQFYVTGSYFDFLRNNYPKNGIIFEFKRAMEQQFSSNDKFKYLKIYNGSGPLNASNVYVTLKIFYSPKTDTTEVIMKNVAERFSQKNAFNEENENIKFFEKLNIEIDYYERMKFLNVSIKCDVEGFKNEEELLKKFESLNKNTKNPQNAFGSIIFSDEFARDPKSQINIKYKVRTPGEIVDEIDFNHHNDLIYTEKTVFNLNFIKDKDNLGKATYSRYWWSGFLILQKAVDTSIKDYIVNNYEETSSYQSNDIWKMKKITSLEELYIKTLHLNSWSDFQICVNISVAVFLLTVINIVKTLVREKEKQLKEYMKIMGLKPYINWLSHLIVNIIKLVPTIILYTILISYVAKKTDVSLIAFLVGLFILNVIHLSFFISTLFQKSVMSIFAAFAIWVLLCLHAIIIFYEESEYSNITKFFGSFNPVVHFGHAIFDIRNFENFDGMHWSLLWEPFSPENTYLFGYHILLYLCNNTMLFILSNYIEAVNPFGYGIPQPLYYFVLPSYWFPSYFQKISDECIGEDTQLESKSHDKENKTQSNNIVSLEEYEIDEPSIVIKNLTKVYEFTLLSKIKNFIFGSSKRKNSLTNVNLKLYDNKLSVILGHNGAGKTTIFSILCGMITPTSGTVIINGYDIRKNIDEIRKTFGFCPQHNILIDEFTVMDHLKFYCKLKGSNFDEEEAMRLLKDLKMDFKVNCYARKLSGGQKRKLCLIIALIGDSKFVILDEPSSGLDPGARHDIWSLIIKEKKNRTILLTTHYMEEADVLGDKICILAKGELLCAGSSMLLKNTYGKGYEITIIFNKLVVAKDIMKENVDILLQYFKTFFPDVEYASSFGEEAKFIVNRKYKKEFGKFFKSLESKVEEFNIFSFGVSITTLEEVFLKVNEMNKIKNEEDIKTVENKEPLNKNLNDLKNIEKSRNGLSYLVKQFKALFIKRSIFVYRNFGCIFIGIIIPLLILLPFQNVVSLFKHSRTVLINYTPLNTGNLNYYKHTKERSYILFDRSQFGKDISEILKQSNSKMIEIFVPKDKSDSTPSLILYEMAKLKQRISLFYTPMGFSSYTKNVLDNETTIYKGFFNPMVIHSKPLVLNKIDIHILRKETGNNKLTITTINHPIPFNKQLYISKENGLGTIYSDIELRFRLQRYSILLSILLSSLTIFLLREKCSNSRKIQMLAGIKIWTYYLTTFIWDYLHYMIISFCMIISLKISGVEPLVKEATDILTLIFVIKLYGWSGISFNYLLHHMFNSVSQGFLVSLSINVITTIALEIIKLILGLKIKNLDNRYMVELLFSLIFPVHNINMCLFKLYKNGKERNECSVIDCSGKNSNFNKKCCGNAEEKIYVDNILINTSKRGLLPEVIILIFQGILYFSIVYGIENNFFKKHNPFKGKDNCDTDSCSTKDDDYKPKMEDDNFEDNDVKDVKKYVASEDPSNHSIVVSGVTKCYKKNKAVKGISFYVDQKQCFGLLGVNGAGKTSTFKMLSGECHYCKGDAYINGVDVKHEWNNIDSSIGYCPQIDAILMEMTCEEVLYMYGRIYGMSNEDLGYVAETIMNMLEIIIYRKKQIKNLSGGNKRKVSMAIAIISMPDILLLDEPTAGVDPIASRLVWNILSEIREYGSSIVLTTHSMNECEAICTSLAIMVYGKFKCYGSLQALKSKYGNQFNLLIKLKDLSMNENMIKKILEIFPGSILVENHSTKLHFKIPKKENTKYSELFENLESLVEPFKISDYTLSQTSLEEIFVEFSKSVE